MISRPWNSAGEVCVNFKDGRRKAWVERSALDVRRTCFHSTRQGVSKCVCGGVPDKIGGSIGAGQTS